MCFTLAVGKNYTTRNVHCDIRQNCWPTYPLHAYCTAQTINRVIQMRLNPLCVRRFFMSFSSLCACSVCVVRFPVVVVVTVLHSAAHENNCRRVSACVRIAKKLTCPNDTNDQIHGCCEHGVNSYLYGSYEQQEVAFASVDVCAKQYQNNRLALFNPSNRREEKRKSHKY